MLTPLVSLQFSARKSTFVVGDLVTVSLFGNKEAGARVTRQDAHNVWVKLAGLRVPEPYAVGDRLVLDRDKVIDW